MVIRRFNWLVVMTIAVLGPLLGLGGGYLLATEFGADETAAVDEAQDGEATKEADDAEATHPPVALPNGNEVQLDELAPGRSAAVVVMKSPRCPVCQKQLIRLSDHLDDVQHVGGAVYGLSTGSVEQNREMMQELDLHVPIVSDASKDFLKSAGLWLEDRGYAMPAVIFLNAEGEIERIERGRKPGDRQERMILRGLRKMHPDCN